MHLFRRLTLRWMLSGGLPLTNRTSYIGFQEHGCSGEPDKSAMAARPIVGWTSATLHSIRSYSLPSSTRIRSDQRVLGDQTRPARVKHSKPTASVFSSCLRKFRHRLRKRGIGRWHVKYDGPGAQAIPGESLRTGLRYCRCCSTKAARGNART